MASFVDGRAGGLRVHAMFVDEGLDGFLDYRAYEPKRVQFKLGACEKHLPALEAVLKATYEAGYTISPAIIAAALEGVDRT